MRLLSRWRATLVCAGLLMPCLAGTARAQDYAPTDPPLWHPLYHDRPESGGLFVAAEFIFMTQTRTLDNQRVAMRGFFDSNGSTTGVPGTFVGSAREALNTENSLGRNTYQPGYQVTLGYKLVGGVTLHASWLHLHSAKYTAGATLVPPNFIQPANGDDRYITAAVFNFPTAFAGPIGSPGIILDRPDVDSDFVAPAIGTPQFASGGAYGVWNAAEEMDILFTQRFNQAEIGARFPGFENNYGRFYTLAGGRFAWFWERFKWRTVDRDAFGIAGPQDVAIYTNIVSNRMYGPYVGCGTDVYLGNRFAFSAETTIAGLLDIVKERAKYARADYFTQQKRARTEYQPVLELAGSLNVHWFPTEGVEVRFGYNAMGFFNTISSRKPIAFDYGNLDPGYESEALRLIHGINVGVGLVF